VFLVFKSTASVELKKKKLSSCNSSLPCHIHLSKTRPSLLLGWRDLEITAQCRNSNETLNFPLFLSFVKIERGKEKNVQQKTAAAC
jgi:hypothetical protein